MYGADNLRLGTSELGKRPYGGLWLSTNNTWPWWGMIGYRQYMALVGYGWVQMDTTLVRLDRVRVVNGLGEVGLSMSNTWPWWGRVEYR